MMVSSSSTTETGKERKEPDVPRKKKRKKEKEEDKCKDNKQNYKIKNNVKNRIYKILRKAIIYIRDTIIMTTTVQIIIVRNTCI